MDFTTLNQHLNIRVTEVLEDIVPGGRFHGTEYVAGSIYGGPGDSFKYNIKKLTGSDFATDHTYGDLISLYAGIHNIPMIESAKQLSDKYNFVSTASTQPDLTHYKHGCPTHSWPYHDPQGNIIGYVSRYDTPEGKQFAPHSLIDGKWQMKHLPVPRPLYNLPALNNHADRHVLVCEGEKAATAAQALVGDRYAVVSWPCGAKSVSKVAWGPLAGKRVLIWPDADQAGREAADQIYALIHKTVQSIKILDTNGLPDGYDAADFTGTWPELQKFFTDRLPKPVQVIHKLSTPSEPSDPNAPIITGSLHAAYEELGIAVNSYGNAICNIDNVTRVFEGCLHFKDNIWYDEFLDRIIYRGKPWTDNDDIETAIQLQRHLGLTTITDNHVFKAVSAYAIRNRRNVITDYLSSLQWDQTPRIVTFFQDICGCEDSDYSRAVSQNFLISMVARAYNPGCKVDTMPILESPQGYKKSTMFEILAGDYHANASSNLHHVDFYQCLKGKWIVEFAELHQFSKSDIAKVKDILSSRKDTYRSSYGRSAADHLRKSVFVGTTNEETYLSDNTGARRFWPLTATCIDTERLIRDRDQYFAEAVKLYKSNATWWEVPASAADEQEMRRSRDPWEDDISEYLQFKDRISTQEILKNCLRFDMAKKSKFDEMRVGSILKILGFKRSKIRDGKHLKWEYCRIIKKTFDENEEF